MEVFAHCFGRRGIFFKKQLGAVFMVGPDPFGMTNFSILKKEKEKRGGLFMVNADSGEGRSESFSLIFTNPAQVTRQRPPIAFHPPRPLKLYKHHLFSPRFQPTLRDRGQ